MQAVINGYTQAGVEGQVLSIENGIHRHFNYSDMVEYIRAHVIPIAGVLRSSQDISNSASEKLFKRIIQYGSEHYLEVGSGN